MIKNNISKDQNIHYVDNNFLLYLLKMSLEFQ
jgi:hypothetical protein